MREDKEMKSRIDWDFIVVIALGAMALGVLVWGLVHGVGMKSMDGLRLVLYTTGITPTL